MKRSALWPICGLALVMSAAVGAETMPTSKWVKLDANGNVSNFYGIPVTLTRAGLKHLPYRVRKRHYYAEGDRYANHRITARDKVEVVVNFNDNGTFYNAWTETPGTFGPKGIRIGSTLADVKAAFPDGDFIFYFEDGYVCTYRTRTNVSFMFDPKDMPPGAFNHDIPRDFPVPDNIKVKTIAVFSKPSPRPKEPEPLDENRTSIRSYRIENDKEIPISELEITRLGEGRSVRLVWHYNNKVAIDRTIDLPDYPDFDIYGADLIYSPEPLVVSFRYGNFKNCEVRLDDRDKVYIKLDVNGATTSTRLPVGVKGVEHDPMPKYTGPTIGSVAHGCRRTFDPKTGASGLEKAD